MNDEKFEQTMKQIDEDLRARGVPIHGRDLHAWFEFMKRANVSSEHPLATRARNWLRAEYGDKLAPSEVRGSMPVLIRGDIYRINFPIIFAPITMCCEPVMPGEERTLTQSHRKIFKFIDGLTDQLGSRLTYDEVRNLRQIFVEGYFAFGPISIARRSNAALVEEACGDLRMACEALLHAKPQTGLSKWASLQASEKFLKAFIARAGKTYKKTHELSDQGCEAEKLGLQGLSLGDLTLLQCKSEVRYDNSLVSTSHAVEAFSASMRTCATTAAGMGFQSQF